jgi:micrococcal nuclease
MTYSTCQPWTYLATVVRWLDGDTCLLEFKVWPDQVAKVKCRLDGINTPEMHTKDIAEKVRGQAALMHVEGLAPIGKEVMVRLVKREKFGRWLVQITLPDGADLTSKMIADGHGVEYHGGPR